MTIDLEELQEHLLIGSTLVEGSTLSEAEATDVLAGRTVQGHPVREIRELVNYRGATEWLLEQFGESAYLSLDLLCGYHAHLVAGLCDDGGRFKSHVNYTMRSDGKRHDYMHPSRVGNAVATWLEAFNHPQGDPLAVGAELYARFQSIHPFTDGNGRIGRVLLACFVHRETGLLFRFHASDKLEHLRAIEATDDGEFDLLREFICARST